MKKATREKGGDMQYPLRIERALWAKVKSRAALEGVTVREVLTKFLTDYARGKR